MTPLLRDYFVADLARDMVAPVVIVTANGFDAAGHSAMSESSCRRRGAHVAGFVINRIRGYGYAASALRNEISVVAKAPVLASVKRHSGGAWGGGGGDVGAAAQALQGVDARIEAKDGARSVHAAIRASEEGWVDGAARVIFGTGRVGGPAARWRRQRRQRLRQRQEAQQRQRRRVRRQREE